MADPNPLAQAAENYARNGWSIFPLRPRDKTPLTAHGFKDASTSIDKVRAWWAKDPTANIGLNCGKSGLVVVDLDKREKHDGRDEWAKLLTKQRLTVKTSTSLTGGGGQHLLFKAPEGVKIGNSAGRLAPGIDIRGDGGYVVLPPSIHPSGRPYTWSDSSASIEELPPAVIDILIHEPDPWQAYTLRDAFAPRPPMQWLVDNIISVGSLSIWYGSPGVLKSMLLTDMAVCVASGARWLGSPNSPTSGIATTACPVMWLDFDNGERRTHERFAALARARKLDDAAPITYYSMPRPRLAAGDTESIRTLTARIVDRNAGLVIIDNLGKVAGDADENSADMQAPMDGLRYIAECGAAVVVIHHQRKSNGLANIRAGETLRGHGSIEAALDLAMLVTRDEETITVTPTKTRGQKIKEFVAKFEYQNDEQHELTSARFWPVDVDAGKAEEEAKDRAEIVAYLKRFPNLSATAVYNHVGGNKQAVLDLLRRMQMDGSILTKKGPGVSLLLYV